MMNKYLSLFVLSLGMQACSCAKTNPSPTPVVPTTTSTSPTKPPVLVNVLVSDENWEFMLPSSDWVKKPVTQESVKIIAVNSEKRNLVVFVKESFQQSYETYTLTTIRSLREQGAVLISAKQVFINDLKVVLIESSKNSVRVWQWVYLKDGFGYTLACGGAEDDLLSQKDLCLNVADTLKIK